MKKKICVVTASRADYGLLCWVMKEIKYSRDLELTPVATGMHLSEKYGYTVKEIESEGFKNLIKIRIFDDSSPHGIARSMSQIVDKFAQLFSRKKIDFLILLGDRFEMLAVALAALPFNIPIGHIGGGEISEGVIDDNIRHCLTKLSHLHFPITATCARRIRQMGEEPWRIRVVGSPRLDFIKHVTFKTKEKLCREFGFKFRGKVALVVYHPVTLEVRYTGAQIENLLKALKAVNIETIMFYPNLDTSSDLIIKKIESFAKRNKNVKLFKPLKRIDYLSILHTVDIIIGNSSIGIIEAPSFGLPAVNIGNRQRGRDHVCNVIQVGYSWRNIVNAIKKGLYDNKFRKRLQGIKNPYGDGNASSRIVNILRDIDLSKFKIMKKSCFR